MRYWKTQHQAAVLEDAGFEKVTADTDAHAELSNVMKIFGLADTLVTKSVVSVPNNFIKLLLTEMKK